MTQSDDLRFSILLIGGMFLMVFMADIRHALLPESSTILGGSFTQDEFKDAHSRCKHYPKMGFFDTFFCRLKSTEEMTNGAIFNIYSVGESLKEKIK